MIRLIESIIKKHLDEGIREYERTQELTIVSPYEILWCGPCFSERRELAKELITAIQGTDYSKLIRVPPQAEAEKFIGDHFPLNYDKNFRTYVARELRRWLVMRPSDVKEMPE